jgi:hypothetical protein
MNWLMCVLPHRLIVKDSLFFSAKAGLYYCVYRKTGRVSIPRLGSLRCECEVVQHLRKCLKIPGSDAAYVKALVYHAHDYT